jgi:hypothetical protein
VVGGGLFVVVVWRATATDKKGSTRWLPNSPAVVSAILGGGLKERQAFLVSDRAANLKLDSATSSFAAGWQLGAALLHMIAADVV